MFESSIDNWKYMLPAILWALVILLLSGLSANTLRSLSFADLMSMDKWGHMGAYAILSYLILRGIDNMTGKRAIVLKNLAIVILVSSAYGTLLEILQYTVFEGRFFETFDLIANIIGSLIGAVGYRIVHHKKHVS